MELTRYQFELLTYIEKRKSFVLDHRAISDKICISGNQIDRDMALFVEKGYVEIKDNTLSITDAGKEALEPYRVKKAVILAAGFGSRMMPATADRPKPLVTVNGKRIIETLLDALVDAEIKDITIVRGYKKDRFDELLEKYPFVKFIDNDNYDKYNNISSAVLIGNNFKGGSYLCEADLYITNPAIITKYQYTSNILGSWSLETDDWSFKMDDEGHIRNYQKGNTYCWNYYGISYWTPEDCDKLNRDWADLFDSKDGKDIFWEQVPLQLKPAEYQVEIRPCNKSDIMEIDNYYELAQLDPKYR
ncbi:phosphocholine cytidylyltransferase family protein [Lactobacillus delbrueckii subsp. lactis]|uniref:phosphocholine cytidylyltransferase family protein n=1 Tax=Lactobacillus delbrueckii TaxID=1584 RepID=UPI001E351FF4|nr:phosphocholine cytidylyltransferase family protein [Lactobacillus delbrueckii]MCD5598267.1 phosphocholine cytidylyltransferase family protein [Lactobacillus delbrueckii subsp. lactis]